MGQEWAASTPFLYFTDHEPDLGVLVTQGRREEFKSFRAFADPAARERIPDPQDVATFERSKLRWEERDHPGHAAVLGVVRRMLELRRSDPVLRERCDRGALRARVEHGALVVERRSAAGRRLLLANFGDRAIDVDPSAFGRPIAASRPGQGDGLAPRSAVVVEAS
jgi:maltooligosyltrehalose trehalohydrolase